MLAKSVPDSDIQFHKFGRGDPPNVSRKAMYNLFSWIVKLSCADCADK
jgi:hypothetical protein